jgi:hypothetical protein
VKRKITVTTSIQTLVAQPVVSYFMDWVIPDDLQVIKQLYFNYRVHTAYNDGCKIDIKGKDKVVHVLN